MEAAGDIRRPGTTESGSAGTSQGSDPESGSPPALRSQRVNSPPNGRGFGSSGRRSGEDGGSVREAWTPDSAQSSKNFGTTAKPSPSRGELPPTDELRTLRMAAAGLSQKSLTRVTRFQYKRGLSELINPTSLDEVEEEEEESSDEESETADPLGLNLDDLEVYSDDAFEDEEEVHETDGARYFEFYPVVHVYRVLRVLLFLQMVAIIRDRDVDWPQPFGWAYSWLPFMITFYSRPFIFLYDQIQGLSPFSLTPVEIDLWEYEELIQFGLGIFFVLGTIIVVLWFYIVGDYTHQPDVEQWTAMFVKHWFTAGMVRQTMWFLIPVSIAAAAAALCYLFDDPTFNGNLESTFTIVVVTCVVMVPIWTITLFMFWIVKRVFYRYTGHNSKYTATIVLKALIRTKAELSFILLSLLFFPVVYQSVQTVIPLTDWNYTLAPEPRRNQIIYTPCHWMAFPSNVDSSSGFAQDILSCDSYSGISVSVVGAVWTGSLIVWFMSFVRYMARITERSMVASHWFEPYHAADVKLMHVKADFDSRFSYWALLRLDIRTELRRQVTNLGIFVVFFKRLGRALWGFAVLVVKIALAVIRLAIAILDYIFCSWAIVKAYRVRFKEWRVKRARRAHERKQHALDEKAEADVRAQHRGRLAQTGAAGHGNGGATNVKRIGDISSRRGGRERRQWMCCAKKTKGTFVTRAHAMTTRYIQRMKKVEMTELAHAHESSEWRLRNSLAFKYRGLLKARKGLKMQFATLVREYAADHEQTITAWDSVVDTAGYMFLIRAFGYKKHNWHSFVVAQNLVQILLMATLKYSSSVETQLSTTLFLQVPMIVLTYVRHPFQDLNDAWLDWMLQFAHLFNTILAIRFVNGSLSAGTAGVGLFLINTLVILVLLDMLGIYSWVVNKIRETVAALHDSVADLVFLRVGQKTIGLENIHTGLSLLQQWDDVVEQQRQTGLLGTPMTKPKNLLTFSERVLQVRWAALHNLTLERVRNSLGLTVMHTAFCQAESEVVRWLVHAYPKMIYAQDSQRDTPVGIALKECAWFLTMWGQLHHGKFRQLREGEVEVDEMSVTTDNVDSDAEARRWWNSGEGLKAFIPVAFMTDQLRQDVPTSVMKWRLVKFAEIMLSKQIQERCKALKWDLQAFRNYTAISDRQRGRLAQHLALVFNLNSPEGFSRLSDWVLYSDRIVRYLTEMYVSCRTTIDLSDSELGDAALPCFDGLMAAMRRDRSMFVLPSPFVVPTPILIYKLNLSKNRLTSADADQIVHVLESKTTLYYLDVSDNLIDEVGGNKIFQTLGRDGSARITTLRFARNRLGPRCGQALATFLQRSKSIRVLDLCGNRLGSRTEVLHDFKTERIPSAGPRIGVGLQHNQGLEFLDLSDNHLGSNCSLDCGRTFGRALRKNQTLRFLELAGNELGDDGASQILLRPESKPGIRHLGLSRNQIGHDGGFMATSFVRVHQGLTSLDLSHNPIMTKASKGLVLALRQNVALLSLNLCNIQAGPLLLNELGESLGSVSSLTNLDISRNPVDETSFQGGDAKLIGVQLRLGLAANRSLTNLNLSATRLPPQEVLPILTGLCRCRTLRKIGLASLFLDGPCCLQLVQFWKYDNIEAIDLTDCRMGPRQGSVIAQYSLEAVDRVRVLDLEQNYIGSLAALHVAHLIKHPRCRVQKLHLRKNTLTTAGIVVIARALAQNLSVTHVDFSDNDAEEDAAKAMQEALTPSLLAGKLTQRCRLVSLDMSDNPKIGGRMGARLLAALAGPDLKTVRMRRTGLTAVAGNVVARAIRDPVTAWVDLDLSHNRLCRSGINKIMWSLRRNRSLRSINLCDNAAGPVFGAAADALGEHGVGVLEAMQHNITLNELDLSYNGLSPEGVMNICNAVSANFGICVLRLRGVNMTDDAGVLLIRHVSQTLQITEVDIGDNQVGYETCEAIGKMLMDNDTVQVLRLDHNELGDGGLPKMHWLLRSMEVNTTLRELHLDGNRLGGEFGAKLSASVRQNDTLRVLGLADTRMDARAGASWAETLAKNMTLVELRISEEEVSEREFEKIQALLQHKRPDMLDVHPGDKAQQESQKEAEENARLYKLELEKMELEEKLKEEKEVTRQEWETTDEYMRRLRKMQKAKIREQRWQEKIQRRADREKRREERQAQLALEREVRLEAEAKANAGLIDHIKHLVTRKTYRELELADNSTEHSGSQPGRPPPRHANNKVAPATTQQQPVPAGDLQLASKRTPTKT